MRLPRRAATLTAAAGLIACVVVACRPAPGGPATTRDALRDAVATNLPFDARLSGGFAPSTRTGSRAGGESREDLSPDTRIAIALLEKRAGEMATPQALADLGVAFLVQGDVDRAIATINDAASQGPAAAPWSDLSAAYLVKAERTPPRRIEFLARALDAAERSLRVSPSNEALFNRALARDRLAPYTGTAAPWTDYLAAEQNPQWRDAATREAGNDRPVADARDLWEARRRELRRRLAQPDAAFASETVRLHPEAALEFFEQDALVEWSRAAAAGQTEQMQAARAQARLLADALYEVTRDPMPRDEVAALGGGWGGLARAHEAYAQGLAQYDANDLVNARRSLTRALDGFARTNAPYRAWASAQLASIDFQERDLASAARRLAAVEREARAGGYVTLLGRALWLRGLVSSREWRLTESLSAFREAAATFEAAAEREYAVSLYHHLADTLRTLGEQHESWEYIGRTLDGLPRVRKPLRRYLFLYNAALFASSQDLLEAALIFQDATVREAAKAGSDVLVEATIQRALVQIRRGDQAGGRVDLEAVAARLATMPAGAFKSYVGAELEIARAQIGGADEQATDGLRHAISFFDRAEPARVPGLYLLLARTPQARASTATAEVALRAGIARLEGQQAGLGDEALKISYFDESWALFQDMVTLQAGAGNEPAAFEFAERSRARSLLAAAQGSAHSRTRLLAEIQAMLPPSVVIVHYSTLADRVLIWTITATAARLVERRVEEPALGRLVEQHRAAIRYRRDNAAVNDRLHELLIQPVAAALTPSATVVLVPDGPLQQLPFSTLRDPRTHRFLIEDYALMATPSASFFVDAHAAAAGRAGTPYSSALLVGNPGAAGAAALPGAEAEAAAAAEGYARHELLTGRAATKLRFLQLAPAFEVVHFGGHSLVNPEFPLLSRLVFADEAGVEQSLFAHEIARVRFPRTRLVVLAACSTASGVVSRGEGVVSVARPFLGAGVPLVIASQWDVDDRATGQLSLAFHRELARSRDPVRALRAAQLSMLRSGDPTQASPDNWGAFVAVGTTAS